MAAEMKARLQLGCNIRARRKELGLSQVELAERVGVTQVYLSRFERGTDSPNFERLLLLCNALETTPNDLIGFAGEKISV